MNAGKNIIHRIHRFKSSDWLKEGHMTWIIFDNVHVWKLIHVCYFLLYHDCSDLSHVLVFTITWQEKKPGDIMV